MDIKIKTKTTEFYQSETVKCTQKSKILKNPKDFLYLLEIFDFKEIFGELGNSVRCE